MKYLLLVTFSLLFACHASLCMAGVPRVALMPSAGENAGGNAVKETAEGDIGSVDDKEMTVALVARNTCSAETLKIVDLLEVELVGSLPVQVLDRTRMTEIFREHALSASGLVNADTALTLGRLCGAELLLNVHEYKGISEQKHVVFSLFSTVSGLKVAQKSMAIEMPETISRLMTTWIGQVLPELDKGGLFSVAFLGVHSLELGDSLNPHAAHISVMLEEILLSQAGVAVLDLQKLHWLGEERRLQSVVEEKLSLSKTLIRANVEWNTYPDDIRVTVYLSGTDQVKGDPKTQIVTVEAIDTELPAFFKEVSASIETTTEIRPLNAKQEAQKLYLLGKSFFEIKRYDQAADYARTAYDLDPARKEIGRFAYYAEIEDIIRVTYSRCVPGYLIEPAKVNASLRALPKAIDLLIQSREKGESVSDLLAIINNGYYLSWITALRGWAEYEDAMNGLRSSLYKLTVCAINELGTNGTKASFRGYSLDPWYRVADSMSDTLNLWRLVFAHADHLSAQEREQYGKSVASTFWGCAVSSAPKCSDAFGSGGEAWVRKLLFGYEHELEQFYQQLMQSSYLELQKHGGLGLQKLSMFRQTGKMTESYEDTVLGKGDYKEVHYLIRIRHDFHAALALARTLAKEGHADASNENFRHDLQLLERWDLNRQGKGDPFWNNGKKLFPAEQDAQWDLGAATLVDGTLWFVGMRKDNKVKPRQIVLIRLDTETGAYSEVSSFSVPLPEAPFGRRENIDLLGDNRLARINDTFYYASTHYGIICFPIDGGPATNIAMKEGMPSHNCQNLVVHGNWVIASFVDAKTSINAGLTALVAWNPELSEIKHIIHPSKESLLEDGDKSLVITGIASDKTRNCIWVATKNDSDRGWSNERRITGIYRVELSPWRIAAEEFPPYKGIIRKQTDVYYASSVEVTESALWFNRKGRRGRWLSYDFTSRSYDNPASQWGVDSLVRHGPYLFSGHYLFINTRDYIDTRNGKIHTIGQPPGQRFIDSHPSFFGAVENEAVVIMHCFPAIFEVWLIDTTKELGI